VKGNFLFAFFIELSNAKTTQTGFLSFNSLYSGSRGQHGRESATMQHGIGSKEDGTVFEKRLRVCDYLRECHDSF
jgi:hypothetical protein